MNTPSTPRYDKTGLDEEPRRSGGGGGIPTYAPEKLSLWDRLFNRTRREVHDRGEETWTKTPVSYGMPFTSMTRYYTRTWIEYRVIDRLTGSVTIEREYLT